MVRRSRILGFTGQGNPHHGPDLNDVHHYGGRVSSRPFLPRNTDIYYHQESKTLGVRVYLLEKSWSYG